ncbi:hypothetical protein [Parendozoicomonas sp. Alg238-R29]|uniref:hypothetical protein n=1 Tax=Parendozoicomonas sp. Alg238-R29 TaxID=2993446 RepID=UPI00248D4FF2|nr:hypothetical protein [Parendozoicomonas sp. Alg238-R29]
MIGCACAQGDDKTPESHTVTPAGTFFPRDDGTLLYFEGVDVFVEMGNALQGGVLGAMKGMVMTYYAMSALALLPATGPGAVLAGVLTVLWKYRLPLTWWYSYKTAIHGLWNYQYSRVGSMPVYFASPDLQKQLVVNWRFPLADERTIQLDIVTLPYLHFLHIAKNSEILADHEQGWLRLSETLHRKQVARMVISLKTNHLVLSVQKNSGHWWHRTLPRPENQPLLAEGIVSWEGRKMLNSVFSLLSENSTEFWEKSLDCQEGELYPLLIPDKKIADSEQASIVSLFRPADDAAEVSGCAYLGISDYSTRYGGLAGYMHLNGLNSCDQVEPLLEKYSQYDFENQLIVANHVQVVPYWATTLLLRGIEEGISIGIRYAIDPFVPEPPERKYKTAADTDKSKENSSNEWQDWIEAQGIRGLSLGKPDVESYFANGKIFCRWYLGSGVQ